MSVSRPRSISMSSAGRSSQKGRRPSFLNDKGEVRLVENGFDLTPLPLLVDEAPPDEVEEVVAEREAARTSPLQENVRPEPRAEAHVDSKRRRARS